MRRLGPLPEEMKKLGKVYEVEIYEGAGHGFLRQQDGRDGANMRASQQAWTGCSGFSESICECYYIG